MSLRVPDIRGDGPPPAARPQRWREVVPIHRMPEAKSWRQFVRDAGDGVLSVIVSQDPHERFVDCYQWHLSIAHPSRYPTWDEIAQARYDLVPDDVTMVMLLPPRREYVNVHKNCFHLHEAPR